MKNAIVKFLRDEEGATAIEYGLIAGLMATILVAVFPTLSTALSGLFTAIAGKLVVN